MRRSAISAAARVADPLPRAEAAGLLFGGAGVPLGGREVSRTAEVWGWCEWLRISLLLAALAAAALVISPRAIAQRARAQAPHPLDPPALASAASAGTAAIGAIHYWSDDRSTTVSVDLPGLVVFAGHRLTGPDRVYFDLQGTEMPADVQGRLIQVPVEETLVRRIRVAQWKPGVTRVVFETTRSCDYSAMIAPNPYRLVVKLQDRE